MRRVLLVIGCVTFACPPAQTTPDAHVEVPREDASVDAGQPEVDAGRQRFDAGTLDAGFSTASVASWCRERALATCLRQVRCLALDEANLSRCVARAVDGCDQISLSVGVDAGRLRFSTTTAVECLNGFSAGSCAIDPAPCARAFTGAVAEDGGCVTATDCIENTYCDTSRSACPGRCSTFRALGERCSFFERCATPFACFPGDGGLEVCQPAKAPGATCVDFDECGQDALCLSGRCVGRRADAGEACAITSGLPSCDEDSFCRQEPPAVAGEPADAGTCQRRVGLGGTCVGGGFCLASLRCSAIVTTGTCLPRAPQGGTCASAQDCEDGLFCSNTTQRCEPLPADGGNCSFTFGSNGLCQPGYFCQYVTLDDRRCERRRALGERCDYDQMCLSNECEYGLLVDGGFGGTCQVPCSLKADAGL